MSSTPAKRKRISPLLFFALLAGAVVGGMTYYKHLQSTPIESQETSTAEQQAQKTLQAGEDFLAKKAKEPGVQSLGAGILYKELKAGTGATPQQNSTVVVDYEGRLIDGSIFDSSYQRGEAAEFPVGGVIAGWQIALKAMKEGAVWELYLPHYMAYGERGSGANIPPFSALVFKVELKAVR